MSSLTEWIDHILRSFLAHTNRDDIIKKVEKMDKQGREIGHDLKNLHQRSSALHQLVSKMRSDEAWEREKRDGKI